MTIEWIKPRRAGRASAASGIYIGSTRAGKDRPPQLVIGIQQDAMSAMRWQIGDRVAVGFDVFTDRLHLRRCQDGFKITARSTRQRNGAEGKSIPGTVKMEMPDFLDHERLPISTPINLCIIGDQDIAASIRQAVK